MTTYTGRSATKSGKPAVVQRGTKSKWGTTSPSTPAQLGIPSASAPTLSSATGPAASKETISEADAKHMHDRMLFLLSHMIGMSVEITVKNGSKYEGIFHTAFTEGEFGIVLRLARVVSGKDKKDDSTVINQLIILAKDCMAINTVGVDFVPHERTGPERGEREGFKTDTDISRAGEIRERDLQKWAPEERLPFEGIEDSLHNGRAGWDQFAANEKLFGVTTDFDEELYTTKLDRTGSDFKAREQQAIQIANEIQQSVSNNVHMREERGLAVDDSGLDEEDLYGAVVRDPLPVVTNKYMPPALRRQQELNQQRRPTTPAHQSRTTPSPVQVPSVTQTTASQLSKPPTFQNHPSAQPAQPVQPASLQEPSPAERPTERASGSSATAANVTATSITMTTVTSTSVSTTTSTTNTTTSENTSTIATSATATSPAVANSVDGSSVSRSSSTKGSSGSAQFNLNELRTHNPVSTLLNAATIQRSKQQQIPEHAVDSKQIEDNLAKFAMTAVAFATNDRALVNQTKMGLTQRKTELFQKEKDGLAAELKQFGKELTKKLNTPVPDEVKEIFSKKGDNAVTHDKAKVNMAAGTTEMHQKDNKEKEKEKEKERQKEEDNEKDKDKNTKQVKDTAILTKSTISTEKSASEKPGLTFKFNVKASEFKPNVNAIPFTPSFVSSDKKTGTTTTLSANSVADKNLFFGKSIKKGPFVLQELMSSPFKEGQPTPSPSSITPTWPYGQRPFRHLFQVTSRYEDDMMYSQGMGQHGGNGAGGYYAMSTPYSYGPSGQFAMPPQMTMAGPSHMVPFIGTAGPVPFSQPPPPPPGMPHTGAGPGFPQLAPTSAPHYPPQGFPPGRSNMIPPSGLLPMYPYPPSAHGAPVMMPYPPREIIPPLGPNGMIMHQRPMSLDPQMMHYPAGVRETGSSEGDLAPSEPAATNS